MECFETIVSSQEFSSMISSTGGSPFFSAINTKPAILSELECTGFGVSGDACQHFTRRLQRQAYNHRQARALALLHRQSNTHALSSLSDQLRADMQARPAPALQDCVGLGKEPDFPGITTAGHATDFGTGVERPAHGHSLGRIKDQLAGLGQSLPVGLPCAGKMMDRLGICN